MKQFDALRKADGEFVAQEVSDSALMMLQEAGISPVEVACGQFIMAIKIIRNAGDLKPMPDEIISMCLASLMSALELTPERMEQVRATLQDVTDYVKNKVEGGTLQ